MLFVAASCGVAQVLLLTVGGADSLYSVQDLWTSLGGSGFDGPTAAAMGWRGLLVGPIAWLTALPSWLVFGALGGLLLLMGSGGRERSFG